MNDIEFRQSIYNLLSGMQGLESLKRLFWSELNYERENQAISRRGWSERVAEVLVEDPLLLAMGGLDFRVIYGRLRSEKLSLEGERLVSNQLLKEHPYLLFVFSNYSQNQWHFVNVKYDSKREKQQLFRRIRVGAGEQLRTATERLSLLDLSLLDLPSGQNLEQLSPLAILELCDRAFDVEAVTDKFFKQYRLVFEKVENAIKPTLADDEGRRLFTQKLFNRLMFIVFIQKKGWLSFADSTDYLTALWQDYQQESSSSNHNFYRDRLSHLFFAGLNNPDQTDIIGINNGGYLKQLIGTVPYLNGGLFEQDGEDRKPEIVVPDEAIRLILEELFNQFNFTVMESTPLDVEVAVDPEMLGRVFEELVTGRHESGSYYTPKPIVAFMCREALKGYLMSKLETESLPAIALFVDEHNAQDLRNPEAVLAALQLVKVCDPACGSGAYLLGLLHELLDLRQCLFATKGIDSKTVYQRKLEIIEGNIYGVDLDVFAVNIARLRLWLSLAVEYEGNDPPPLPNLKFKIEVGDSLIAPNPQGSGLVREEFIRQFRVEKAKYLRAHLGKDKLAIEAKIKDLKTQIGLLTHGGKSVTGFDWVVEFAEVVAEGGFDIQVANPPYVRQELFQEIKPALKKVYPEVYTGTSDLYCFFYARALQLLKTGGMLAFISPNKWFRAKYGEKLREHIAHTCQVKSITDFGDLPVFKSAAVLVTIFIAQKNLEKQESIQFTKVQSLQSPYPDVKAVIREQGSILTNNSLNGKNWLLSDSQTAKLINKMETVGIPLGEYVEGQIHYGIKTGFNKAFIIDGKKREELIAKDSKNEDIIKPLAVGDDVRKWRINYQDKWLIFIPWHFPLHEDIRINGSSLEAEKEFKKNYLSIYNHLLQYEKELSSRNQSETGIRYEWYALQRCAATYYTEFEKPKIIYPVIAKESRFAFDTLGSFTNDKAFIIPVNDLYLLGVLNSSIVWNYLKTFCSDLLGKSIELRSIYIAKIPIPPASESEKEPIIQLVQKCLAAKGVNCEQWEKEIDEKVAALYGL